MIVLEKNANVYHGIGVYLDKDTLGGGGVKMHSDSGQTLTWHQACLQCSVCQVTLSLQNVVFKEKLFCKSCYIESALNKCGKCVKVIYLDTL